MDNWNYPMGADNSSAPWNEPDDVIIPVDGVVYLGFEVPVDSEVVWADVYDMRQEVYSQISKPEDIIKMIEEGKTEDAIAALKTYTQFEIVEEDLNFHEPSEPEEREYED